MVGWKIVAKSIEFQFRELSTITHESLFNNNSTFHLVQPGAGGEGLELWGPGDVRPPVAIGDFT